MVTITFTKQERKALRKGSTLLFVSMPPPWDTGSMGGVRVPTYRNRVVIFYFIKSEILYLEAFVAKAGFWNDFLCLVFSLKCALYKYLDSSFYRIYYPTHLYTV